METRDVIVFLSAKNGGLRDVRLLRHVKRERIFRGREGQEGGGIGKVLNGDLAGNDFAD